MSAAPDPALAQAIARVVRELALERPRVRELGGGGLNRSLRLTDAQEDVVLRVAPAVEGLGADRRSELVIHRLAAEAGLAPPVRFADLARGILVTTYVPGRVPARDELRDPGMLARVGSWLAALHRLSVPAGAVTVDIGARAATLLGAVADPSSTVPVASLLRALAARRAALGPPARLAACHHDLHHRNLLDAGPLLAIDWEYAGAGDPAADVAAVIGYHELGPREIDALLAGYGSDTPGLRVRVAALAWIFDCLWLGWIVAARRAGFEGEPDLQQRLAARLLT